MHAPIIRIQPRPHYGTLLLYPMNEGAKLLCRLTGTKTLTAEHLAAAQAMGCTIAMDNPVDGLTIAINARATSLHESERSL